MAGTTNGPSSPNGKKVMDKQARFKEMGAKKDELETKLKSEFTDYTKSIVTKQSANPKAQKPQSKEQRKTALNQIRLEKVTDEEIGVGDIANYIGKELKAGWATDGRS